MKLNLSAFMPSRQLTATGIVDTVVKRSDVPSPTYDSSFWLKTTYAADVIGEEIRRRFTKPVGELCVRVSYNYKPDEWIAIPPIYWKYLRVGDRIKFVYSTAGKDGYCLGTLQTILEFEDMPVRSQSDLQLSTERPHWMELEIEDRVPVGPTYLDYHRGRTSRFLRITHLLPAEGDRVIIAAGPGVGKSTFIGNLMEEVYEDVEIVYIGAERPEDLIKFLRKVGHLKVTVFSAPETSPALRRLHIAELGMQRAMRLAEQGKRVVIVMDSLTKAIAKPVNGLPSPVTGVGIQEGGVSPVLSDVVSFIVGLGGNYGWCSISEVIVVLNENDKASNYLITFAQSISTGHIFLHETMPYWPKIVFSPLKVGSNTLPASFVRWMAEHQPKALVSASEDLRKKLSVQETVDSRFADLDGQPSSGRVVQQGVEVKARRAVTQLVADILKWIDEGLSDTALFARLDIVYLPDPEEEAAQQANRTVRSPRPVYQDVTPPTTRPPLKHERGEAEVGKPAVSGGARAPRAAA